MDPQGPPSPSLQDGPPWGPSRSTQHAFLPAFPSPPAPHLHLGWQQTVESVAREVTSAATPSQSSSTPPLSRPPPPPPPGGNAATPYTPSSAARRIDSQFASTTPLSPDYGRTPAPPTPGLGAFGAALRARSDPSGNSGAVAGSGSTGAYAPAAAGGSGRGAASSTDVPAIVLQSSAAVQLIWRRFFKVAGAGSMHLAPPSFCPRFAFNEWNPPPSLASRGEVRAGPRCEMLPAIVNGWDWTLPPPPVLIGLDFSRPAPSHFHVSCPPDDVSTCLTPCCLAGADQPSS